MTTPPTPDAGPRQAWAQAHARTVTGLASGPPIDSARAHTPLRPHDVRMAAAPDARPGHERSVEAVALTRLADGTPMLASASSDHTIRLSNPTTGVVLHTLVGHTDIMRAVAFTTLSDGTTLLASAGYDSTIRLWNPTNGALLHTLTGHTNTVYSVAFTTLPDGTPLLASASDDATVRLWNPTTATLVHTLNGHTDGVYSVAFTTLSGAPLLASASSDTTVRIWNPTTATLQHTLTGHSGSVYSVALTTLPDGTPLLASASADNTVRLWNPITTSLLHTLTGHTDLVRSVAFTTLNDGTTLLASAGNDTTIRLWNPAIAIPLTSTTGVVNNGLSLALLPLADGSVLLASDIHTTDDSGNEPGLWRITLSRQGVNRDPSFAVGSEQTLLGHTDTARTTGITSGVDGPLLASASDDRTVRLWNPTTGVLIQTLTGHTGLVNSIAITTRPDDTPLLASAGNDATIRLWNPTTATLLHTLTDHTNAVYSVAFAILSDGTPLLASASNDNTIRLWNPTTATLLHTLTGHTGPVNSVALTARPDGPPVLASASFDATVRLWNPTTATLVHTLTGHTGPVNSVALITLPDGTTLLASAGNDRAVRLWNPTTAALVHTLTGHDHVVYSVAFTTLPDGVPLLASADNGGHIRLWNPINGRLLFSLDAPVWERLVYAEICLYWHDASRLVVAHPNDAAVVLTTIEVTGYDLPEVTEPARGRLSAAALDGLVALAAGDLHPPLGLLAELIGLLGRGGAQDTGPLAGLAHHDGIELLRNLDWPPRARVGLAALLLIDATHYPRYIAPPDPLPLLHRALRTAVAESHGAIDAPPPPMPALLAAASTIDNRTVALMTLLGPDTVAADPTLPLRLRHVAERLPHLSLSARTMITAVATQQPTRPDNRSSSSAAANDTNGISRRGTLPNLLHTLWALPQATFDHRMARGDLLYRLREGQAAARVEPLNLILDTTPATFGPVESVLRLVAFCLARTTLAAGKDLRLITLHDPTHARPIRRPIDLLALWTVRGLRPPDLPTALHTAAGMGLRRTILLSEHHLVHRSGVAATPALRIVTTHAPDDPPTRPLAGRYYLHLPPQATPSHITRAVAQLLAPAEADGA